MSLNLHENVQFQKLFATAVNRFWLLFQNKADFLLIVAKGLKFIGAKNWENKLGLLEIGFFSEELLQAMICGGEEYHPQPVNYIWKRLVDREIVVQAIGHMPGALADHQLMEPRLLRYITANTLPNIFAPPSELIARYGNAIVAIDVLTASGSESRGTGFVVTSEHSNRQFLITCKHNVDPNEGIQIKEIKTARGATIGIGTPLLHPTDDLAVFSLDQNAVAEPSFYFRTQAAIFDEVYTLGYPMVPCAKDGTVLGHRGEVNGTAELYIDGSAVLIISNLVSPGNSGGPVLDRDGFCVGMSIKWLEGEWDGEKARFSAALPASTILSFLETLN